MYTLAWNWQELSTKSLTIGSYSQKKNLYAPKNPTITCYAVTWVANSQTLTFACHLATFYFKKSETWKSIKMISLLLHYTQIRPVFPVFNPHLMDLQLHQCGTLDFCNWLCDCTISGSVVCYICIIKEMKGWTPDLGTPQ